MKTRERECRGNMRYFGKPISLPQLITTVQMHYSGYMYQPTFFPPQYILGDTVSAAHWPTSSKYACYLRSSFLTTSREADEYQYCLRTLTLEWCVIGLLLTFSGMFQRCYYSVHKKQHQLSQQRWIFQKILVTLASLQPITLGYFQNTGSGTKHECNSVRIHFPCSLPLLDCKYS